jgi:hypothetical protein
MDEAKSALCYQPEKGRQGKISAQGPCLLDLRKAHETFILFSIFEGAALPQAIPSIAAVTLQCVGHISRKINLLVNLFWFLLCLECGICVCLKLWPGRE